MIALTDALETTSPRRLARIAGALYAINIVLGAYAIGLVPALLGSGAPAATARGIEAHQLLYRSGLAAHLIVTATNVPMGIIFFDLFKIVNRRFALLDLFFGLVATAVEVAGLLGQFTPLVLLSNSSYADTLPAAQLDALATLPGDLSTIDYSIYGVFYGLGFVFFSYLVITSGFLPRLIGILLAIDAAGYLIDGFASILVPGFAAHLDPWIELPTIIGEGSLCVWLLVVGVDVARWCERAVAHAPRADLAMLASSP